MNPHRLHDTEQAVIPRPASPNGVANPARDGNEPASILDAQASSFQMLSRSQLIATLAGIIATLFLSALDQTIVGTAMPRVVADLHGFDLYAWTFTAYMVASTAFVPIVGKLSDLYGRKRFLLSGVVIFILGSILCGAAQDMTQLVIFRGLQGLGAGLNQAMAITTIADLFPPKRRAKITGIFGAVFGISSVVGPLVGGFLTDGPGWRWVFFVNVPVGLTALFILFFFFPVLRPVHRTKPSIDVWGALTLLLAVVPLLFALSWGGRERPWDSPLILGLLGLAAVMTAVFLWVEQRVSEPIVPMHLFRNRVVSVSTIAIALTSIGTFGAVLFIPLFVQAVIGTSATQSGAAITPMVMAMVASSIVAGQIMGKLGRYHAVALVSVMITAVGMGLLATMNADTDWGTVVRYMVVLGLGLGGTMPVFSLAIQNSVPQRFVGAATSTSQFFRSIGGAIGAAIFGAVLTNRFVPAFHAALPESVARALPSEQLARFDNPQALINPETLGALQQTLAALGPQGQTIVGQLLGALRIALATSLHDVFAGATAVLVLATVVVLFLPEVRLRSTLEHPAAAAEVPERAKERVGPRG